MSTFDQRLSNILFPHNLCSLEDVSTLRYLPIIECRFAIFRKILHSKPVQRRFSVIKLFLKNCEKFAERYVCWRLFFNKVAGCRLKQDSGAGALL